VPTDDRQPPSRGTATPPQAPATASGLLRRAARRDPKGLALVFPERQPAPGLSLSFAELDREVDRAARGLVALQVRAGETIAIVAPNVPEWVVLQFAAARVGATLAAVNPGLTAREMEAALRVADPAVLVAGKAARGPDPTPAVRSLAAKSPFPRLRHAIAIGEAALPGALSWQRLLLEGDDADPAEAKRREEAVRADDVALLLFTSGSTGEPKGVLLAHGSVCRNANDFTAIGEFGPRDRLLVQVPFFHCFGCVVSTLGSVACGAANVVTSWFDPPFSLSVAARHKCTLMHGVPTMFSKLLEVKGREQLDLDALRAGIVGGAPAPPALMRRIATELAVPLVAVGYGLTEASPALTANPPSAPESERIEAAGRALPGVELRIVDPATGRDLPDGEAGELWARGYNVMKGYKDDAAATAKALDRAGWLRTGDLATRDSTGVVRIRGRLKDLVIRGGENVSPAEVEAALREHPDVLDAQVVGVPDATLGEEVAAAVRYRPGAKPDPAALAAFARERLAPFKVPRHVLAFEGDFPASGTGKVRKADVREWVVARLAPKSG